MPKGIPLTTFRMYTLSVLHCIIYSVYIDNEILMNNVY